MVGGGIEILGRAAVALHGTQVGVAGIDRSAAQLEEALEQAGEGRRIRRFHQHAQVRSFDVGATDAEFLYFEPAVVFHDLVEDVLHDVGIDQVAFRFDHFLK